MPEADAGPGGEARPGEPACKKIAFLTPRLDLSPDAFRRYWREVHGPVVGGTPGYATWRRRYVQNHIVAPGPFGRPLAYAGMAEFWLPGSNEENFAESATYRDHIRPDEMKFIDMDRTISMTALEHTISPGRGRAKLVVLSGRATGLDGSGYAEALLDHARRNAPELREAFIGYALNLVIEGSFRLPGARPIARPRIDAVHEFWFGSPGDLDGAGWTRLLRRALDFDEPALHAPDGLSSFVAEEIVFFDASSAVELAERHTR